jgi:cytochrome c
VFAGCASCHSLGNNAGGMAPGLGGIVGSVVASRPGYDYSPALKVLGGRWTEERLDAFLADPGAVAPGSRMSYRVPGLEDRAAVIAFLRDLR